MVSGGPSSRGPKSNRDGPDTFASRVHRPTAPDRWGDVGRSLRETRQLAAFLLDVRGIITAAGAGVKTLLGYAEEQLVGRPLLSLIGKDDQGKRPDSLARRFEDRSPGNSEDKPPECCQCEAIFRTSSGGEIDVNLAVVPLKEERDDPAGDAGASLCILQDVSRIAGDTLPRFTSERFRAITDCALDAIILIDQDGTISHWNAAAEEIFGYGVEETIGRNVHELLAPPEYRAQAVKGVQRFALTGEGPLLQQTRTMTALRKDGKTIPIELALSAFRIENRWWASAFVRDVTQRRETEESLKAYSHMLEETNQRLDAMRREAEAATESKSLFLANMSHEIRTPLTGILGMTELLLDTELTEEQREYAETVAKSGELLLKTISNILDFSKIEAGELRLEMVPISLVKFVDDVLDIMAFKTAERGLELIAMIDPTTPDMVVGDAVRLSQIVINLIGNAVKFTPSGEVVFAISPESHQDFGVTLRFEVRDTGVGIPESKLATLFDAFTQADASVTRCYGGTGLGLAICRRLVELMGGEIGVESKPGRGTTFWLTADFEIAPRMAESSVEQRGALAGKRILAVDGNETNRKLLSLLLKYWSAEFQVVDDPFVAFNTLYESMLRGEPFDVVLIDGWMPGMDGWELTRRIKTDPLFTNLPVLLTAALPTPGEESRRHQPAKADTTISARPDAIVTKPLRAGPLCLRLRDLCFPELCRLEASPAGDTIGKVPAGSPAARVLVVDDNAINLRLVGRVLQKLGHQVTTAKDGQQAIEHLRAEEFDLVLMDVQMPVLDGVEAIRLARRPDSGVRDPRVPIIALSAYSLREDRDRCLGAGADDYLTKPVRPETLREAVARVLSRRPGELEKATDRDAQVSADVENGRPGASEAIEIPPRLPRPVADMSTAVDLEQLYAKCGGDPQLVREVLHAFLASFEDDLRVIDSAIAQGQAAELHQSVHKFRGTLASLHAEVAAEAATTLEMLGRRAELSDARSTFELLDAEVRRVIEIVAEMIDS